MKRRPHAGLSVSFFFPCSFFASPLFFPFPIHSLSFRPLLLHKLAEDKEELGGCGTRVSRTTGRSDVMVFRSIAQSLLPRVSQRELLLPFLPRFVVSWFQGRPCEGDTQKDRSFHEIPPLSRLFLFLSVSLPRARDWPPYRRRWRD